MRTPKQFIVEGVDRTGKGTLTESLLQEIGYHLMIHYEKPKKLRFYEKEAHPLKRYQEDLYSDMFELIDSGIHLILDRAHLSEAVYAPMYRGYSGDYVFNFEKQVATHETRLILLTTSDFSFIKDDGLSHDFSKKEVEQTLFIEAFSRSRIEDKVIIDVSNGRGGYRPAHEILASALKNSVLSSRGRL